MEPQKIERMIRDQLEFRKLSMKELAKGMGMTRANLYHKLQTGNYTINDLEKAAGVMDCELSVGFINKLRLIYAVDDENKIVLGTLMAPSTISVDEVMYLLNVVPDAIVSKYGLHGWDPCKLYIERPDRGGELL